MDKRSIEHISDSNYSFPISNNEIKVRIRIKKGDDVKKIECLRNDSSYFYKERKITEMSYIFDDDLFSYYEAILSDSSNRYSYIFYITLNNGKKLYYSESGISETYDYSLSYFNRFRISYANHNDIVFDNKKFQGNVFYQIFPERFCRGNFTKDSSYINAEWDTTNLKGSNNNRHQDVYIGGDLKGVTNKLDYLKELGVDVIYLTPICKGGSNHKYDVIDYFKIDEMFGDNAEFLELCNSAHSKGMKIILDLVFNHSSNLNKMFLDVKEKGKESKYYDFYVIHGDKPDETRLNYDTFGNVPEMPKLNSNNYDEQDYFVSVGKYFVEKFGVDGYRLDVADEVSHDFWLNFKMQLRRIKPDIVLIGECRGNARSYLSSDQFESVMNYPFFYACKDFYVNKTLSNNDFAEKLNSLLIRYTDNNARMMLNLLDSHDTERFYNFIKPNKDLYLLAVLTLIMYVGWPMIYYGNEIFMEGGTDPANRKGMEWDSKEFGNKYNKLFNEIILLRKNACLKEGKIRISTFNDLLYIERYNKSEKIISIINNSNSVKQVNLEGDLILSNNYSDKTLSSFGFVVSKMKII